MTSAAYDEIAEWYDAWVGDDAMQDDFLLPTVQSLLGDVTAQEVCDLGCGQGRIARYLAGRGARVTGIDLSGRMLDLARRREQAEPRGIIYRQDDAHALTGEADSAFDGVLCYMALMDIPDLRQTLRTVSRVLRPDGWFVFSILHPCYNPPPSGELSTPTGWVRTVSGYWDEGYWRSSTRTGPPGKVGSYHRTLGSYVNELIDAGFTIECVLEPKATGRAAEARSVWAEVPAYLVVRCRKTTQSGDET
ncbi:MAG: class I SAM-dependent methyltransferase [Chloroflexi bacterium]|nr:class I SAM-dependent methyltransferase [Chloroflexota bacterium]